MTNTFGERPSWATWLKPKTALLYCLVRVRKHNHLSQTLLRPQKGGLCDRKVLIPGLTEARSGWHILVITLPLWQTVTRITCLYPYHQSKKYHPTLWEGGICGHQWPPKFPQMHLCGHLEPGLHKGRTAFQVLGPRWRLTKLRKNDVLLIVDTMNAEFRSHKNIWQKIWKKLLEQSQQFRWNQFQLGKR